MFTWRGFPPDGRVRLLWPRIKSTITTLALFTVLAFAAVGAWTIYTALHRIDFPSRMTLQHTLDSLNVKMDSVDADFDILQLRSNKQQAWLGEITSMKCPHRR